MAGWACACCGVRCVCKQTRAGSALRGLRARVSARSQPGRVCSFSPSLVLFLTLVCPVASSACACPTAQLPPLPGWPKGHWPCWADPADCPQQGQSGHVFLFWKHLSRVIEGPCAIHTAQVIQVPYQVCLVWPGIRVRTFWHQHVLQILCLDDIVRSLF